MRTYTTGKAAALAGCSRATMARLKQKGVLEGGRGFVKAPNQQFLTAVVDEATKGRHGWKWRPRGRRSRVGLMSTEEIYRRLSTTVPEEQLEGVGYTRPEDRAGVTGLPPCVTDSRLPNLEGKTAEEIYKALNGPPSRELPELGMPDKSPVAALKLWTTFSWERRSLLLRLAERYTDEELQLLVEL